MTAVDGSPPRSVPPGNRLLRDSAAARFRRTRGRRLVVGIAVAAVLHAAFLLLLPTLDAVDGGSRSPDLQVVTVAEEEPPPPPPEVEVPARPGALPRPAEPPEPPAEDERGSTPVPEPAASAPTYIPHDVPPRLINVPRVRQFLREFYPVDLGAARVGGAVTLWIYIDEAGEVVRSRVQESSGYPAFDRTARAAVSVMKFRPARNGGQPTPVWVSQRIRFTISAAPVSGRGASPGSPPSPSSPGPPGSGRP